MVLLIGHYRAGTFSSRERLAAFTRAAFAYTVRGGQRRKWNYSTVNRQSAT